MALAKDAGQFPTRLAQHLGGEATMVFYAEACNSDLPKTFQHTTRLLRTAGWVRYLPFFGRVGLVPSLFRLARSHDVLMLFHVNMASYLCAVLYAWLNPKGKVYCKADMSMGSLEYLLEIDRWRERRHGLLNPRNWKDAIRYRSFASLFKHADILSVESQVCHGRLLEARPFDLDPIKILLLPNFMDDVGLDAMEPVEARENVFLVVGRIGHHLKNHELILEALNDLEPDEWCLRFVGPVMEGFRAKVDDFLRVHPQWKSRLSLLGEITDRAELTHQYRRAKVFLLPSRSEGFSHALVEAAANGCFIVATDVGGVRDVTDNGRLGLIIAGRDGLRTAIKLCIAGERPHAEDHRRQRAFVMERFSPSRIISRLSEALFPAT